MAQRMREAALQAQARQRGVADDERDIDEPSSDSQQATMMPTGDEMFRILKSLDLTYKTEMIFVSQSIF